MDGRAKPLMDLSVCLATHLSIYLSICLSVCLYVCLSICLSVYLSNLHMLHIYIYTHLSNLVQSKNVAIYLRYPSRYLYFSFSLSSALGCSLQLDCLLHCPRRRGACLCRFLAPDLPPKEGHALLLEFLHPGGSVKAPPEQPSGAAMFAGDSKNSSEARNKS